MVNIIGNLLKRDNALVYLLNSLKHIAYVLNTQCSVHQNKIMLQKGVTIPQCLVIHLNLIFVDGSFKDGYVPIKYGS